MSNNFAATRAGMAVPVTTASVNWSLGADARLVGAATDVLIDNRGTADAYVVFGGDGAVVTVATGLRIPPGSQQIYAKGNTTNMAVIGGAATNLVLHLGAGD